MPYFIYKITSGSAGAIKSLELIDQYDEFKSAKKFIREKRPEIEIDSRTALKRLSAPRDAPILREWEK